MFLSVTISSCIGFLLVVGHQVCHVAADERVGESPGPTHTQLSKRHGARSQDELKTEVDKHTIDQKSDVVLQKLSSCCRRYQKHSLNSDTILPRSEAKNETVHSSCHSLLLATLPRRLHNKGSKRICRKLAVKVCSILVNGKDAIINGVINKTRDLFIESSTVNTLLGNRIRRNSNSEYFGGMDLLEKLNDLAVFDTIEMDGGSDIKNELLERLIDVINNENLPLERPEDDLNLSIENDQTLDINDSTFLGKGLRSKRVKVRSRSDFSAADDQTDKQKLTEEKLMRKLQKESKTCGLKVESILLAVPGCVPKSIIATRCQGSCPSWSSPVWREDSLEHVQRCTCCMPLQLKTKIFALDCPSMHKGQFTVRQISVPYPFKCMCLPCENAPEIKAEQPYDY